MTVDLDLWAQWADVAAANGITKVTFGDRVKGGWSPEESATRPLRKAIVYTLADGRDAVAVAAEHGISRATLMQRIREQGWSVERACTEPPGHYRYGSKPKVEAPVVPAVTPVVVRAKTTLVLDGFRRCLHVRRGQLEADESAVADRTTMWITCETHACGNREARVDSGTCAWCLQPCDDLRPLHVEDEGVTATGPACPGCIEQHS